MRADKTYDNYERKVVDILTLLGDLGGLKEFILLVGQLIVGFITQKMFLASIIKKTYHVRKYDNIDYEMKKKLAVKRSEERIVINIDDKNDKNKNVHSIQSERQKIYPIPEIFKEGEVQIKDD